MKKNNTGKYLLQWPDTLDVLQTLSKIGETPLPPYIERKPIDTYDDRELYQTVYAKNEGSVAAPTAGLHFTKSFMNELKDNKVSIAEVTLHVGPGTFQPVECDTIKDHVMHDEWFEISTKTIEAIQQAKKNGNRIIAVGTTTMRVLESAAAKENDLIKPQQNRTNIFIHPPYTFRIVDALLTNFHLPKSTLLMLTSAFAAPDKNNGRELIMQAYNEAIEKRYRFFSYGDAMFLHL
jgi:S-adenosylmethionine:tRNA ribosyltransferase-isomerase